MDSENFMWLEVEEAKIAKTNGDLPFGAIIVCDEKVVGTGHAQNNTTGDVTCHAELIALRNACKNLGKNDLSNCVIYCTNEPCMMCSAGIFQAGIPKVIIGASRKDLPNLLRSRKYNIEHLAEDSSYKIEIVRDLLKDEVLKLFN